MTWTACFSGVFCVAPCRVAYPTRTRRTRQGQGSVRRLSGLSGRCRVPHPTGPIARTPMKQGVCSARPGRVGLSGGLTGGRVLSLK
jgi:hypothetical protein